jgi:uncharacterized phage protein (TIGR02218 family)
VVDCIEILVPGETYRFAASTQDVSVAERTFRSSTIAVSPISDREVVITVPADSAFARRFLAGGVPKNQTRITWWRVDEDGTIFLRLDGDIVSAELGQQEIHLRLVSSLARALRKPIGRIVSRTCQHKLFDAGCRLDRSSFTRAATIIDISGYEMTVNVALVPDWAVGGELIHVASTERSLVVGQRLDVASSGTVLTLQARSYNAGKDHPVEVTAGCDHQIQTCAQKFDNVMNYGGFPYLPSKNPFRR